MAGTNNMSHSICNYIIWLSLFAVWPGATNAVVRQYESVLSVSIWDRLDWKWCHRTLPVDWCLRKEPLQHFNRRIVTTSDRHPRGAALCLRLCSTSQKRCPCIRLSLSAYIAFSSRISLSLYIIYIYPFRLGGRCRTRLLVSIKYHKMVGFWKPL